MDIPPPPTTATAGVNGFEVELPNSVQPYRFGKHPTPPSTDDVHNHHQPLPLIGFAYGKCNKNYAASVGGHVLDGCGEFTPLLTSSPSDPTFLYCDACGCHRSFHHETEHYYPPYHHVIEYQFPPHHLYHPHASPPSAMPRGNNTPSSASPSPISTHYPTTPHMSFSVNPSVPTQSGSHDGRKQIRSKFSQNQKEMMQEFAERLRWKMLKKDEEIIMGFCKNIGVPKHVFNVWMNNHKNLRGNGPLH